MFVLSEALNAVSIAAEKLKPATLMKFKAQNKKFHIHRACAQLWAKGVPWQTATQIVKDAFEGSIIET